MRDFGLKHTRPCARHRKRCAAAARQRLLDDLTSALAEAERIGYPVMLKSTAGGGGIGMQQCREAGELRAAFDRVRRLAATISATAACFWRRYVAHARHIEVQIFGDGDGRVMALGERDCSLQRRNQKVIEETPAPNLSERCARSSGDAPSAWAAAARYRSAGTVEFIVDAARGCGERSRPFISWRSTRGCRSSTASPKPSPGSTWCEWMVRCRGRRTAAAAGTIAMRRAAIAIQARLYAEDPARAFPARQRPALRRALPAGRCALTPGSRPAPRYRALLRPDAGQADCACADARSGDRAA